MIREQATITAVRDNILVRELVLVLEGQYINMSRDSKLQNSFEKIFTLEGCTGPRRTEFCFWGKELLKPSLHRYNGPAGCPWAWFGMLCVDNTQVGVNFRCLLESHDSRGLEAQVSLEVLGNFSNHTLEWQLVLLKWNMISKLFCCLFSLLSFSLSLLIYMYNV